MILHSIQGLISLIALIVFCELLENSICWAGKKFKLDRGIFGHILTAVGTALPATIVPVAAILFIPGRAGEEIGNGAIIGAPLMLSTLLYGLVGAAVFARGAGIKKGRYTLDVDLKEISFDLLFFMVLYALAVLFSLFPQAYKKIFSAVFLLAYVIYALRLSSKKGNAAEADLNALYFSPGKNPSRQAVIIQSVFSIAGIVLGAKFFADSMAGISAALGTPLLLTALIIAPLAVELPEKFNSVLWAGRKKDSLAALSISGALVFQSSVVVFVGVAATDWYLNPQAKLAVLISLVSSAIMFISIKYFKKLHAAALVPGLLFYAAYIILATKWVR